ncbi:hypothetical protein AWZ03_014435, partial [Drosophila navojoa]
IINCSIMFKLYKLWAKWKMTKTGIKPQFDFRRKRGKRCRGGLNFPIAFKNGKVVPLRRVDNNVIVTHRINVPRLKSHWESRDFDLKVPAYVSKYNLIQPLITWKLLDHIMKVPLRQATAVFQAHVCFHLKLHYT